MFFSGQPLELPVQVVLHQLEQLLSVVVQFLGAYTAYLQQLELGAGAGGGRRLEGAVVEHRMLCETTAAIGTAGEVIAGHLDAYHAGCRDGDQTAIRAAEITG